MFYKDQPEPNKSCLLALRSIILNFNENISETQKWGLPCFCYFKKMFCFLSIDKKTNFPYILMVEGIHLKNSALEQGTRKRMKILKVNPNKDIDIELVENILKEALSLYDEKGLKAYITI